MRKRNNDMKNYLNEKIASDLENETWDFKRGANYGVEFQKLISKYYLDKKKSLHIKDVTLNFNQNSREPDILISYKDNKCLEVETKSCKEGALSGVTICNSPNLLNDRFTLLVNYTFKNKRLFVLEVIETQLFRLVTINKKGKYKGCLTSTRDTGKKIKGRSFSSFINSIPEDDFSLEELTCPKLIRRTILYYSTSKLVDDTLGFTEDEVLVAFRELSYRNCQ